MSRSRRQRDKFTADIARDFFYLVRTYEGPFTVERIS
jgi:hypothetical protein